MASIDAMMANRIGEIDQRNPLKGTSPKFFPAVIAGEPEEPRDAPLGSGACQVENRCSALSRIDRK